MNGDPRSRGGTRYIIVMRHRCNYNKSALSQPGAERRPETNETKASRALPASALAVDFLSSGTMSSAAFFTRPERRSRRANKKGGEDDQPSYAHTHTRYPDDDDDDDETRVPSAARKTRTLFCFARGRRLDPVDPGQRSRDVKRGPLIRFKSSQNGRPAHLAQTFRHSQPAIQRNDSTSTILSFPSRSAFRMRTNEKIKHLEDISTPFRTVHARPCSSVRQSLDAGVWRRES